MKLVPPRHSDPQDKTHRRGSGGLISPLSVGEKPALLTKWRMRQPAVNSIYFVDVSLCDFTARVVPAAVGHSKHLVRENESVEVKTLEATLRVHLMLGRRLVFTTDPRATRVQHFKTVRSVDHLGTMHQGSIVETSCSHEWLAARR